MTVNPARVPASIRNRNPGAMYPGPSARRFGAVAHATLDSRDGRHKIATFTSHEDGAAALFHLLATSKHYAGKRLDDAIRVWCGGHYVETYLGVIARHAGVVGDAVLTIDALADPTFAIPLARAMARQEAGMAYPLDAEGWQHAHDLFLDALGRAPSPIDMRRVSPPAEPEPGSPTPGEMRDAGRWHPDNEMPSPRPETRAEDGLARSRKWTLLGALRQGFAWLGVGAGGVKIADDAGLALPAIDSIKGLAADNAALLVIGGVLAGLVLVEAVRHLQRQDLIEGRYEPSGYREDR